MRLNSRDLKSMENNYLPTKAVCTGKEKGMFQSLSHLNK